MKRKQKEYLSYFVLAAFLFLLLNFPASLAWRMGRIFVFPVELFAKGTHSEGELERMSLRIENRALKEQIEYIRAWLESEERIDTLMTRLDDLTEAPSYSGFLGQKIKDLRSRIGKELYSVEAKVIFRDPALWGSGVWIDRGSKHNDALQRQIIAKNSPVLVGSTLVGVVENVEEERSYVRLITDAALTPSVRALRGGEQNRLLLNQITRLEESLSLRGDLEHIEPLLVKLKELRLDLEDECTDNYLAKGELSGSSYPLWRCRSNTLMGRGFNLEFDDVYASKQHIHDSHRTALIAVGDLLVTTGMDGVFPSGLEVATVTKISPLKEGGFAYDLEARSTAPDLNEITIVSILPPLGG